MSDAPVALSVALSLRQPWAWMVVHGGKTIENRKWNTTRRGPILIHAAKGMTKAEYDSAVYFAHVVNPELAIPDMAKLLRGGIIGRARIVDVLEPCLPSNGRYPCTHGWHMPEQHGFVLEDIEPLPFRPLRGELGFFKVAADG